MLYFVCVLLAVSPYASAFTNSSVKHHDVPKVCYEIVKDGLYTCVISSELYCMISYDGPRPCQVALDDCIGDATCTEDEVNCMSPFAKCVNDRINDLAACKAGGNSQECLDKAKDDHFRCRSHAINSHTCWGLAEHCKNMFHCRVPCQKEKEGCNFFNTECRDAYRGAGMAACLYYH